MLRNIKEKLTKDTASSALPFALVVVFLVLYEISFYNYLLYHTTIEFFAIFVGFSLSLIAFSTRSICKNKLFAKIGIIYFFVSATDFIHTLAYKGMNIFHGWTANEPTQLWILGRTLEIGGFFALYFLNARDTKNLKFAWFFATASIAGILLIATDNFPDCFIEGYGLTKFKITMEYIIIVASLLLILKIKQMSPKGNNGDGEPFHKGIQLSLFLTALGEASFTLYSDVYGFFNFLGHMFRFLSYLVLLRGLVARSFLNPVHTLLAELDAERRKLEDLAYYDKLTGLYSRSFFEESLKSI